MIILVHSETDAGSVASRLGLAEYSYFFVLRAFRPVLERIGMVVPISDPAREVDRLWRQACLRGEPCVFLSFAPPHRTQLRLACPTIPVFAWEFDTIPHEMWSGEPRHDWVAVLRELGQAIVHSAETVRVVRAALGDDFPVVSIPAPVWDGFASGASVAHPAQTKIQWRGSVIDTNTIGMASLKHDVNWVELVLAERARGGRVQRVVLDGVVYTAVLNPDDGRKNWADMISAFCRVFHATPDATLVLKLTHHDGVWGMALILKHLVRLWPFDCRIVLIHGFLPDADYARLVAVTAFTVNTSHGEGQCLPLMEAMSAGKPAVAPSHTGMADYVHEDCAFIVRSTAEPTHWPQDGRAAIRTLRRRIDPGSLEQAYRESYVVWTTDRVRYQAMAASAFETVRLHCSAELTETRLRTFFEGSLGQPGMLAHNDDPYTVPLMTGLPMTIRPASFTALDQRIGALRYFQSSAPPDLADYDMLDPFSPADNAILSARFNLQGKAAPGNVIFMHRAARKAVSPTSIRMSGTQNVLLVDAACMMHGSLTMDGDANLAIFLGDQSELAIGATFYGHDNLVWGRGASSFGMRIWMQGATTCTIGEGCLFSENITIRCTDHHSIFDLDTAQQINVPADVTIGRHVWIGQDCAIGKGVTLGDGSIIGARSLVVKDTGKAELWAGSPARKLRDRVSWTLSHPVADPVELETVRALLA